MNKGRYVFRQMCDFLLTDKIEWIIEKYNGDRYTKTFSCWQHLLVMILAQLWQCRSLRVLVNVLNSQKGKLYQTGIGKGVCRSTLAWANEHRDYRIFEKIANLMIENARAELFEGQIIYGINLKYIHTIFYSIVLPNKLQD